MAYTRFGEFARILRIQHHQVMGDMAAILGASTPFLSAVENGKKNVPADWAEIIIKRYELDTDKARELYEAIEESKTQYKIVTANAGARQRRAAFKFARSFEDIDDDTAEKILELLNNKKGN